MAVDAIDRFHSSSFTPRDETPRNESAMDKQRIFTSWPIRVKILLLLLFVFLPACGIVVASGVYRRADEIRKAESKALLLARSLAAQQEQIASGTKQMLGTLALLPEVQRLDEDACNKIFRELQNRYPFYSVIHAETPDGNVFAASSPFPPDSVNLSDRKHIKDAIRTLDFSPGEYIVGRVVTVPSINYAYPVLDANKNLVAILTAGFNLDEFARFVDKANLPESTVISITDHAGALLHRLPENDAIVPGQLCSEGSFNMISNDSARQTFEETGQDNVLRICAFEKLCLTASSPAYLYMIVGIPKNAVLYQSNREMFTSLLILAIAAFIAMSFAWIFGDLTLIRPIRHLVGATQRFGEGDMAARTNLPHTSDEFGQLAKSFDDMALLLEMKNIERNRVEEELQEARNGLEINVAERTAALVSANETLQKEIAERKLAEEALRESEKHFRTLVDNAPEAIFIQSQRHFVYVNHAVVKLYGAESEKDLLGQPVLERVHPDFRSEVRRCMRLVEEERVPVQAAPRRHLRLDGTAIEVETTTAPFTYNKIPAILVFIRDVTDRIKAKQAIRESRQQLADIIDFLPDATFVIDKESKVIAWNKAIEEMSGTKASDMLGRGNYEYALPFYGKRRPILIDLVLKPNEEIQKEYARTEKRGRVIEGESCLPAIRDKQLCFRGTASVLRDSSGNIVGAIESIRDITERRFTEEALAKAEEKYRDIFENSLTGIFQISPKGRFLSLNRTMAKGLGYDSPEEALRAESEAPMLYVHPERRLELYRLIEKHGLARDFEAEFFRKDKSIMWVNLYIRAVRDRDGNIAYLEGNARDITESKNLKAQLDQARKMEAIGTLAGGIAHDFNNILTPIIGYAELSLNSVPEGSRLSQNMRQVIISANRAKDLVKQILTFSRKTKQEKRPVQVGILVKEALKLLRATLPSTIEIRQLLHPDAIESCTMADPTQIHQVLMNLCTNAAQACARGGVLSVKLENVDIGRCAAMGSHDFGPGPYLRLSVEDTGCGMDAAVQQRIFDPYFTTKGPNEGTGLGLAVVYGIVKDLSGAMTISSEPGKGTTFDVYFPRTMTIPAPSTELPEILPTGQGWVLVVDDEKFIVDMIGEMLEMLGYEVVRRYSSVDAIESFSAWPGSFDLVITDMTMPHMTGIDLAKEIFKIRPHIPIILCTGFSGDIDKNRAKALGIKAFLMKPVALRDLATVVSKSLIQDSRPQSF